MSVTAIIARSAVSRSYCIHCCCMYYILLGSNLITRRVRCRARKDHHEKSSGCGADRMASENPPFYIYSFSLTSPYVIYLAVINQERRLHFIADGCDMIFLDYLPQIVGNNPLWSYQFGTFHSFGIFWLLPTPHPLILQSALQTRTACNVTWTWIS